MALSWQDEHEWLLQQTGVVEMEKDGEPWCWCTICNKWANQSHISSSLHERRLAWHTAAMARLDRADARPVPAAQPAAQQAPQMHAPPGPHVSEYDSGWRDGYQAGFAQALESMMTGYAKGAATQGKGADSNGKGADAKGKGDDYNGTGADAQGKGDDTKGKGANAEGKGGKGDDTQGKGADAQG